MRIKYLLFLFILAAIFIFNPRYAHAQDTARDQAIDIAIAQAKSSQQQAPPKQRILDEAVSGTQSQIQPAPASEETAVSEEAAVSEEVVPEKKVVKAPSDFKVSGEYRLNFGYERDDPIYTQSNFDYWERNWRLLYGDLKQNTYDTSVYDRLRFNLDKEAKNSWGMRANVTIDPWSYTGKSSKVTILGTGAPGVTDPVELELKWWGNTRKTINELYYTKSLGDALYFPETKTIDGKTTPMTLTSIFGTTYNIPEIEIKKTFIPLREFWVNYDSEVLDFKIFPLAYENQGYVSDDPLGLSNHHIYWEPSPWLWEWEPGNNNVGAAPNDFTQGRWSFEQAFYTRDGDGTRLTTLRGANIRVTPTKDFVIEAQAASPKTLWQDYDSFDNFPGVVRAKNKFFNCFTLGGIYTYRYGYKKNKNDSYNHVMGADFDYEFVPKFHIKGEAATSRSQYDRTTSFKTKERGNVFQASLSRDKVLDRQGEMAKGDYCGQLTFTHMDEAFDPALASYRFTRNDMFWGRHIFFDHPNPKKSIKTKSFSSSPGYPSLYIYDFLPYRIGDGIDIGRNTVRFNAEAKPTENLEMLFDVRNVHNTSGGYIETAMRNETTYKFNPKLTGKLMLLYVDLPKVRKGEDPFLYDPYTNKPWINNSIEAGRDPSLGTVSAGLSYDVTKWLTLQGTYEYTNDAAYATSDNPRSLFSGLTFATTPLDDFTLRYPQTFLFQQTAFQYLPPEIYNFKGFNIVRLKSYIMPLEGMDIKLEYTFNDNKFSAGLDDNINHAGVEFDYDITKRIGMGLAYMYSKCVDLGRLVGTSEKVVEDHHNFYGEFRFKVRENGHFLGQYGVYTKTSPNVFATMSPYGGFSPTLDTQHIVRVMYSENF